MKPSSSATSYSTDTSGDEASELDETVELPAALIAERFNASNDEYPESSLHEVQQHLTQLSELGELIHNALNRIATALENPPAAPARREAESGAAETSKTAARKTASRKTVSKKKASKKKASSKKSSTTKASTTTPSI